MTSAVPAAKQKPKAKITGKTKEQFGGGLEAQRKLPTICKVKDPKEQYDQEQIEIRWRERRDLVSFQYQ